MKRNTQGSDYSLLSHLSNFKIINLSIYATLTPPNLVHQAIKRAESKGVLVVGIAGNTGGSIGYFGCWDEVLTVGAINRYKQVAYFSNRGPEVELVAPGEGVLSFSPGGKLVTGSGTSFAAPHVVGTAALLLSQNPGMSLSELKSNLREATYDVGNEGKDYSSGYGVIDAQKAVRKVTSFNDNQGENLASPRSNYNVVEVEFMNDQLADFVNYEGKQIWYSTRY